MRKSMIAALLSGTALLAACGQSEESQTEQTLSDRDEAVAAGSSSNDVNFSDAQGYTKPKQGDICVVLLISTAG